MRELSRQELVDVNVAILKDIHEFCCNNNIKYSLGYGTLLGAIRHQGFIPWDDDADIVMPRPDYEIFTTTYSSHKYKLFKCGKDDEDYVLPFARVSDESTLKIEEESNWKDTGIAVDIYPLDGKPIKNSFFFNLQIKLLKTIIRIKSTVLFKRDRGLFKNCIMSFLKLFCLVFSLKKACICLDGAIQRYSFNESEFVGSYLSPYGKKDCCSRDSFDTMSNVKFENFDFMCLSNSHQYLSNLYGDYMTPPPAEKRVSEHGAKFFKK